MGRYLKAEQVFRHFLLMCLLSSIIFFISTAGQAQDIRERLQKKSAAAMSYVESLKKDPAKQGILFQVVTLLKQVKPLVMARKPFEAEKKLDQVLAIKAARANHDGLKAPHISTAWEKLRIPGIKTRGGIFDPSIVHDPRTGVLWMAYSTIFGPGKFPQTKAGPFIRTSLAKSVDGGESWAFVKHLNTSTYAKLNVAPLGQLEGAWRAEVPQLVFDPNDPGREWKLFVHRYFWDEKKDRLPVLGWIAYSYASHPVAPWSKEVPYFGADKRFPLAPFNKARFTLGDFPKLKKFQFVAYSEPGALYHKGVLYVALVGLKKHGPDSLILLSSRDHGRSWQCAEKCILANRFDARPLGYENFDGIGLAHMNGRPVLLVSPGKQGLLHDGTMIIPFDNIKTGKLARHPNGVLKFSKHIKPQQAFINQTGGGQSAYSEWGLQKIFLMPQTNFTTYPEVFNIYRKVK